MLDICLYLYQKMVRVLQRNRRERFLKNCSHDLWGLSSIRFVGQVEKAENRGKISMLQTQGRILSSQGSLNFFS